ncbi:triple tyrosine motif-containing protein [Clostridium cibarium]|uniref:Two component regulator three Y domain-containing protein n=1 Tax=Clostridium cibarium TaxID=2762247 RepID=A0ABR8PR11_9CLOT|nr:triple tyrosine motif-containing protein [Clostridium cibarium]MBD7910619.1 hypothetical protein [Clostridium cibarium]
MKKRFLSTLLVVAMTFSFLGTNIQAKATENEKVNTNDINSNENGSEDISVQGNRFGVKEETPQVKEWKKENVEEVKSAGLNSLGQERTRKNSFKGLQAATNTDKKVDLSNEGQAVKDVSSLPSVVDNSKLDCFPGIGNQGQVGSCTSFASTYYEMSHMVNLMLGRSGKTDENRFSPKWTYNLINHGKDEGSSIGENYWAIRDVGAISLKDLPYVGSPKPETNYLEWQTDGAMWKKAQKYSIEKEESTILGHISNPKDSNLDVIKTKLTNGYVLNYETCWDECEWGKVEDDPNISTDDQYVGEEICKYNNNNGGAGHALTIVGYNDDLWVDINKDNHIDKGERGAFKIANSWGTGYGNKGFYWIAYDAFNQETEVPNNPLSNDKRTKHIGTLMSPSSEVSWIIPKVLSEEPQLYAEFTLNTARREQCGARLIATDKTTKETYSFMPYQFTETYGSGEGGAYGFTGTKEATDGTFVIDLSKVIKDITPEKIESYEWSLKVTDTSKDTLPLKLKDYKIVDEKNNKKYSAFIENPIVVDGNSDQINIFQGYNKLTFKEITTDKPVLSLVNDPINISANVDGGSGSRIYTYSIVTDSGETKEIIKENTTENSVIWTPKETGNFSIKVDVKDTITGETTQLQKLSIINAPISIEDFSVNGENNKPVGSKIYFNMMTSGGCGNSTYTLKVSGPEEYTLDGNKWSPKKAGEYLVTAVAKDEIGNSVEKTLKYTVTDSIGEVSKPSNFKTNRISKNQVRITWNIPDTTTGTIDGYDIYCDGKQINRVPNNSYDMYLDKEPHKFTIVAFSTTGIYSEMSSEIDLSDYRTLNFKEIKTDKESPRLVGNPINITADVDVVSTNSLQYTYRIKELNGVVKEVLNENTSESSITWTPKYTGEYYIEVEVKDTITGEIENQKKIYTINGPINIEDVVTYGEQSGQVGSKVWFNTIISGGDGKISYSYMVSDPEKYTIIENSENSSASWIPTKAGTYWITVLVKDEKGKTMANGIRYIATDSPSSVSKPTNLNLNVIDGDEAKLTWGIPTTTTDAIVGYDIYCDGKKVDRIYQNNYIVPLDKVAHKYFVIAFTGKGTRSEISSEVITPIV